MFPDLSYIFHYIFGSSVDNGFAVVKTFGLFLAFVFLVAIYLVSMELKRKEGLGLMAAQEEDNPALIGVSIKDLITNSLIGFFLGFKLPYIFAHFDSFKKDPGGILFSMEGELIYGVLFGAFIFAMMYMSYKKELAKDKSKLPKRVLVHPYQRIGEIITIAAVSGIIGSRVFSVLENFSDFLRDPIGQLISGSGLTIYGGLIFGFLAVTYYAKSKGIRPIHMMDSAAPALMIGYGIGRMGCQFSGDGDWGIVNNLPKPSWFVFPDWAWVNHYKHNVLNEGIPIPDCVGEYCMQLVPGVFPTPIYEIIYSFLAFMIIWGIRKRITIPGIIFFIYLLFTGVGRFFIEFIRVNPRYNYFGFDLSQAQYIALIFIMIASFGLIYKLRGKSLSQSK